MLTLQCRRILSGNLLLLKDLEELAERGGNTPLIVLKGGALLLAQCAEPEVRTMEDVDILIHRSDWPAVLEALGGMGYTKYPLDPGQYRKGRLAFDIHDEIWYLNEGELRAFWRRSVVVTRSAKAGIVRIPAPEDLLIHTLAHASIHHGEIEPKWADDARAIVSSFKSKIDLPGVRKELMRLGLLPPILWFLRQAEIDWGWKPAKPACDAAASRPLSRHLGRVWYLRSWLFRARYVWRTLFPGLDFIRRRYDLDAVWKAAVWQAIRPFKLSWDGLVALIAG